MNPLTLLIAGRYLLGARSQKNISIMVLICFLGIFIGAFALALVASIMNGFEKITHEKLRGIHAPIIMRSFTQELDIPKISAVLQNEFPQIAAFSPSTYRQIILQKPNAKDISNAIVLKAIDPNAEVKTSTISQKLIQPDNNPPLEQLITDNKIVIGKKLAEQAGMKLGDHIEILYIEPEAVKGRKITLNKKDAIVGGIFSTGIEEFDTNLALGTFSLMQKLFDIAGAQQFSITPKSTTSEDQLIAQLKTRFGLDVFSWKELYPALVSALKLEKYAMFFILALITLVASMNIISLIFMQIMQKRPDIAILQSMGMHNSHIMRLFMLMGVGLAAIAALAGLLAAYITGLVLQKYPFIELPDTYYVSQLPIVMEWHIFALVFALIIIMSIIATWIPARNINSINAAQVLRFEG